MKGEEMVWVIPKCSKKDITRRIYLLSLKLNFLGIESRSVRFGARRSQQEVDQNYSRKLLGQRILVCG